jgi:hypothetical protein
LHYSIRTDDAFVLRVKRFVLFHGKRHPLEMSEPQVVEFLTHLAVHEDVAASTQNQALGVLLFPYKVVLDRPRDRKPQRALLQFFKPENDVEVRQALLTAGRGDLIGSGCDCLIPANPPKAAIEARRRHANEVGEGDHYDSIANPAKGEPVGERGLPNPGYRPGRRTARRQDEKRRRNGGSCGPRP